MPLFHIHGLVTCLAAPLLAGGAVACAPGFEPPRFFSWLNESGTTWYSAVPTMHRIILNRAAKRGDVALARLRFVRSSSAALPEAVYRGLEELFGCPVIEAYGMTEASHQIASNALPPGERKSGSVGRPTGTDIRIFSPDGDALPAGARGEIAIRGAGVHEGYVDNEEANSASFRDGWFLTGDEGFMSTDRELTLTGRLKEIINRGGEKISPLETDRALAEHPDVVQAVTFAVPHPRLGEEVAAAVVRRHGSLLGEQALRAFLSGRLAAFKIPRRIVFLDDIPLGPTGKIQRTGLAQRLGLADPT